MTFEEFEIYAAEISCKFDQVTEIYEQIIGPDQSCLLNKLYIWQNRVKNAKTRTYKSFTLESAKQNVLDIEAELNKRIPQEIIDDLMQKPLSEFDSQCAKNYLDIKYSNY